jgi:hypothetical protein
VLRVEADTPKFGKLYDPRLLVRDKLPTLV